MWDPLRSFWLKVKTVRFVPHYSPLSLAVLYGGHPHTHSKCLSTAGPHSQNTLTEAGSYRRQRTLTVVTNKGTAAFTFSSSKGHLLRRGPWGPAGLSELGRLIILRKRSPQTHFCTYKARTKVPCHKFTSSCPHPVGAVP